MSYSRSYSTVLTVSGSKVVSYPASEHGGSQTVYYSENVPIYVDIDVETYPFDQSISAAGNSVNGLTGSVVAMNAAQCAAIEEGSERISNSLVEGFYNMIRSDISMKQSENNSLLQAKTALLLELSKDVLDAHGRMEQDINRLRAHYGMIFRDLDEDLEKRIQELDKPAFQLGQKTRTKVITEPGVSAGAVTSDALNGSNQTESRLSCARMRKNISTALKIMAQSVRETVLYKNKMNDILWRTDNDQTSTEYMPVMYYMTGGANGEIDHYVIPPVQETNAVLTNVSSYVRNMPGDKWRIIDPEEYQYIEQAFTSMVEQTSQADQNENSNRVYSEMLKLWNTSKTRMTQLHI